MGKYQEGDIVTFYFVVNTIDPDDKIIQAWSKHKDLIKMYMEFHKCKNFKLKSVTNTMDEIYKICNENLHDEVKLYTIGTRDPKHKGEMKSIQIPATQTEINFINEETNTFVSSLIDYGTLNDVIPYLKRKDQKALHDIFLEDITKKVVHERASRLVQAIQIDQLILLYKLFPDNFGI